MSLLHPFGDWGARRIFVLSVMAQYGLQTGGVILIATHLGAAQYGEYILASAITVLVSAFVGLGGGRLVVLRSARDATDYPAALGTALLWLAVSAPPAVLVIALGSSLLYPDLALTVVLPVAIADVAMARLGLVCIEASLAREDRAAASLQQVLAGAVRALGSATYVLTAGEMSARSWVHAYAGIVTLSTVLLVAITLFRGGSPRFRRLGARAHAREGMHVAVGLGTSAWFADADKALLGIWASSAEVAVYTLGYRLAQVVSLVPIALVGSSLRPVFSEASSLHSEELRSAVRKRLVRLAKIASLAVLLLLVSSPLLNVGFSGSYAGVAWVAAALSMMALTQPLHAQLGDYLVGMGLAGRRTLILFSSAAISLALGAVLISQFLTTGAIITTLIAEGLLLSLSARVMYRATHQTKPT